MTYHRIERRLWNFARTYRRDLWADAEDYVEVWVEKDALAGVIVEETYPLDVPLLVAKGYTSKTFAFDAAEDIPRNGSPEDDIDIYHLGDSDPSGEDAARDVEAKLRRIPRSPIRELEIHFKRIAVLDEQIKRRNFPLRPNKAGRQPDQEIPSPSRLGRTGRDPGARASQARPRRHRATRRSRPPRCA